MEPRWVTTSEEVHEYALENDGTCVIAKIPYTDFIGDQEIPHFYEDDGFIVCAFVDPDQAREHNAIKWDYHHCDECECTLFEEYGMEMMEEEDYEDDYFDGEEEASAEYEEYLRRESEMYGKDEDI